MTGERAQEADQIKVDLDEAARLYALKKYESCADILAETLETLYLAPVLHQYGRALLEHVIFTAGALGGDGDGVDVPSANEAVAAKKVDADESKSAGKRKSIHYDPEPAEAEEEEEDDDLAVAFTVLDLARVIYERILDMSADSHTSSEQASPKLILLTGETMEKNALIAELADVHNDLGDVGLETENFEQASTDYNDALELLKPLLSPYSRRLSDAYLRLGLALEFHPDVTRRTNAQPNVEHAAAILRCRLDVLQDPSKAQESTYFAKDRLSTLDQDARNYEIKDVEEVLKDLDAKVEEMKSTPAAAINQEGKLADPKLEEAIRDAFMSAAASALGETMPSSSNDVPVNDLSARVKRKKKN
ncbi:hypothetical protein MVES1_001149 [Malassezia vespertilionis]|uniref:uncharacterized protein n=1 Tax=Malassezia vespertilionis TaxID=2020962 RepID=UPI0024B16E90|nr:uncharacterized protein MVES1_001149 [Malassezia vespertilionis]WFD05815.1 hypothetical protein MVES1_001149 [Malassezia vespertilionis]